MDTNSIKLKKNGQIYKNKPGAGRPFGKKEKEKQRYMQVPLTVEKYNKLIEMAKGMDAIKLRKPARFVKFVIEEYIKNNG